jgi:hypothetical protein
VSVIIALCNACSYGTPELRHRQFLPTVNTRVSSGDEITVGHRKEQRTFQSTDIWSGCYVSHQDPLGGRQPNRTQIRGIMGGIIQPSSCFLHVTQSLCYSELLARLYFPVYVAHVFDVVVQFLWVKYIAGKLAALQI